MLCKNYQKYTGIKLKLDLKVDELFVIKQSLESITIKGKDALMVGKLLERITKSFEKEAEKSEDK